MVLGGFEGGGVLPLGGGVTDEVPPPPHPARRHRDAATPAASQETLFTYRHSHKCDWGRSSRRAARERSDRSRLCGAADVRVSTNAAAAHVRRVLCRTEKEAETKG